MATAQEVQQLYIAYLGRAADPAGLEYWVSGEGAALGLEQLRANFVFEQAEYQDVYGGLDREEMLVTIYSNLFEREPDAEGLEYWLNGEGASVTANDLLLAFLNGASAADQTVIQNKVTVAQAYSAAAGENWSPESAKAAVDSVDGTQASVDAALASIEEQFPEEPGEPGEPGEFTLASGLETLNAAIQAKADFLKGLDLDNNPTTPTTEGDVEAALDAAELAIQNAGVAGYTTDSPAVQAAKVADKKAALALTLSQEQGQVAQAQAAVDKVAGLSAAVAANQAAAADVQQTTQAAALAQNAFTAALANLKTLNDNGTGAADVVAYETGSAGLTDDKITWAVDGGTAVSLVIYDAATKQFKLGADVTEETVPGVTAALNALNGKVAADNASAAAQKTAAATQIAVNDLDLSAAGKTLLTALQVELGAAQAPTRAEVQTEIALRKALLQTAVETDADATGVTFDTDGVATVAGDDTGVAAELDAYNGLVSDYADYVAEADNATTNTPLTDALVVEQGQAKAAEKAIADFDKLVAAEQAAEANAGSLKQLNDAITDATDAFEENDFSAPVTLTGGATDVSTAADDVFVYGGASDTISLFGALGDDVLYIGNNFVFNNASIGTGEGQVALSQAGNNSALEVFLQQVGADTHVILETTAFGSSAATPEVNTIVLTGIALTDVTVADGFITVA